MQNWDMRALTKMPRKYNPMCFSRENDGVNWMATSHIVKHALFYGRRIGIGTRSGFATFSCEPFALEYEDNEHPADILEIFFTSSLVRFHLIVRMLLPPTRFVGCACGVRGSGWFISTSASTIEYEERQRDYLSVVWRQNFGSQVKSASIHCFLGAEDYHLRHEGNEPFVHDWPFLPRHTRCDKSSASYFIVWHECFS